MVLWDYANTLHTFEANCILVGMPYMQRYVQILVKSEGQLCISRMDLPMINLGVMQ